MTKRILLSVALLGAMSAFAAHPRDEIAVDKNLSAANFRAYPEPDGVTLATAPDGYKPFHISSYARHGSRFHIRDWEYDNALKPLQKADSAGVLTEAGRKVMDRIAKVKAMSRGRMGELTSVGVKQHRGIGRRMYRNFPEVFADSAEVKARSTDVIRCIMSMMSECLALQAENPALKINHDASQTDMPYLNNWRYDTELNKEYDDVIRKSMDAQKRKVDASRLMGELFTDKAWVKTNIADPNELVWSIFYVTVNMQSHDDPSLDLFWLFTPEECYGLWMVNNVEWYLKAGDTPLTGNKMHFKQANLLENILADGDSCVLTRRPGATMRFGHESCVIPTAVLMELDNYGYSTDTLDGIDDHWVDYRIFPMACNIQLVFYAKPGSDDVLVRALLNERDVTLPVESNVAPFYRWADVSKYYHAKLNR